MKRRIFAGLSVLVAALVATTVSAAPAHAAGVRCSPIVTITPGVLAEVCIAADVNNRTRAQAVVRNNSNGPKSVEIVLYLNYNGSNHLYAVAGTGGGAGLAPGNAILATQPGTVWTPSGRSAVAEILVNGVYRVVSSPAVF